MMRKNLVFLLVGLIFSFSISCTSVDTSDEESMMAIDDSGAAAGDLGSFEGELQEEGGELFQDMTTESVPTEPPAAEGDFAEQGLSEGFGEEDFSEDAFSEEELSGEAFAQEDFSEEDFSEEAFSEDAFSEEDFGDQPVLEEQPLEAQEFSEEEFAGGDSFEEPIEPAPVLDPATTAPTEITNIKYLSNPNGGTIIIEGSAPLTYTTRVNADTSQFVVEVQNTLLPDRLKRPYILKEFPLAKFGAINAYQDPGSAVARIVIQMKDPAFAEPVVQAEGSSLIVIPSTASGMIADTIEAPGEEVIAEEDLIEEGQVEEIEGAEEISAEEKSYDVAAAAADEQALGARTLDEFLTGNNKFYGRPISIQMKGADIREALSFIANESGMNMIISEEVQGTVTLKLRQVPWDQALVTVMRSKNLGYVREGSVIRIAPLKSLQQEAATAKQILDAQKALTPLRVKVIPVSFAQVEELSKQIKSFLTPNRGQVVFDNRTSSLIVTDTDEILQKTQRLVKELDVPPAQVIIEGKIVEALETFTRSLGVNWGFGGVPIQLSEGGGRDGSPVNLNSSLDIATGASTGNFSLDLQVGTLEILGSLNAQLNLAEQDSLVKVISSPRIVTMNKEKAKITQDSETLAITTVTDPNGVTTKGVKRDPVIIEMEVTPQVTADGNVIMDVAVRREFVGSVLEPETLARPINKRQAQTRILIKNGATAVIGGMYNSAEDSATTGVPWLKDIPVFGWLFKTRDIRKEKNELLIFLTPRILNLKDQNISG